MTIGRTLFLAALLGSTVVSANAQTLRIGLESDPDMLDAHIGRTYVARVVFAAMCDKLIDVNADLSYKPQLATSWEFSEDGLTLDMALRENVTFHDGTSFDAEAVKANIDRAMTLPESSRKSELASVREVEVVDQHKIRFHLDRPDTPLLAQLADRAGIIMSPATFGGDVAANPICAGPFKFKSRVSQDKIELVKFDEYWDAENIHLDGVTYLPIPDSTVRLANLQSGDLDLINRVAATDVPVVEAAPNLVYVNADALGYQGLTFNIGNGPRSDNPFGKDARLRRAVSLAMDREALSQVVFGGTYPAANQFASVTNPYYDETVPVPARDPEAARALLAEAGYADGIDLELLVPNAPENIQIAQMLQAMLGEVGINLKLVTMEFATMVSAGVEGNYQAEYIGWSGRIDPDGNLHTFVHTDGGNNDAKYSNPEVDRLIDEARTITDPAERKALYAEANKILTEDLPIAYMYSNSWLYGHTDKLEGFAPIADGLIRLQGVRLNK